MLFDAVAVKMLLDDVAVIVSAAPKTVAAVATIVVVTHPIAVSS